MAQEVKKSKFKIGQKVWHISNGYVQCQTIMGLIVDKWGAVLVAFVHPDFNSGDYEFKNKELYSEDDLFATRDALMKNIKEQEVIDE